MKHLSRTPRALLRKAPEPRAFAEAIHARVEALMRGDVKPHSLSEWNRAAWIACAAHWARPA